MSFKLQIIIIVCMLIVLLYIFKLMKAKRLDFKFALGWIFVDICIIILSVQPAILEKIAKLVGIASPVNMLFFFGFCFSVAIIFALSMAISRLTDRVKKLSQEIAIIRKDMYDNYNRIEGIKDDIKQL